MTNLDDEKDTHKTMSKPMRAEDTGVGDSKVTLITLQQSSHQIAWEIGDNRWHDKSLNLSNNCERVVTREKKSFERYTVWIIFKLTTSSFVSEMNNPSVESLTCKWDFLHVFPVYTHRFRCSFQTVCTLLFCYSLHLGIPGSTDTYHEQHTRLDQSND